MTRRATPFTRSIIAVAALAAALVAGDSSGEIIRLRDGQVINGEIVSREGGRITVKTKYQVRRFRADEVERIERDKGGLERLSILTRENAVIDGFLVEQDSRQVVYKAAEDSPTSRVISKLDIQRMSNEAIRPVDLEFYLKPGAFFPLNTGGSELGAAPAYTAGVGISSLVIRNLRVVLEAGYSRSENGETPERFMKVTPFTLSASWRHFITRRIEVTPRLGGGITMVEYESGEGDELSGTVSAAVAGLALSYSVLPHRLNAGVYGDYLLLIDGKGLLHTVTAGLFLGFRL